MLTSGMMTTETFPSDMATLKQVLKIQEQIDTTRQKLGNLTDKRQQLVEACSDLKKPVRYVRSPAETFVTIDAVPCRVLVYSDWTVEKEELHF